MTWGEYYSKFYDWATSTQIKRLPYAMLNADVNPVEIVDVARDILDGKAAGRLMKRAANAGIQFTAAQILELSESEADEGLYMILETSSCTFTQSQLDDIYFATSNDNVRRKVVEIARNQGIRLQSVCDDEESEKITPQHKHKRPGLLSALFFGALTDKDSGKMSDLQFSVGDHVRVRYRGQEGTIIGINGDLYMVSLKDGAYVDSYIASDLEKCW
ncbi:hypothetical protein [Gemmiger sp.]